ncbi:MAG: hypothetical protein EPO61_05095 [Nitrospirae bacterium]|nr:MAG: hypothetical protein EPO61_05095 [Nitrospirota bacterium]
MGLVRLEIAFAIFAFLGERIESGLGLLVETLRLLERRFGGLNQFGGFALLLLDLRQAEVKDLKINKRLKLRIQLRLIADMKDGRRTDIDDG